MASFVHSLNEEEVKVLFEHYRERSRELDKLEEMLWEKVRTMPYELGIDQMKAELEELRKKISELENK